MKHYEIRTVGTPEEIENAPRVDVDCFRLGEPGYEPKTTAAVVFLPGRGFLARMESEETELKADCREEDGDTYKDSCLEWFINFAPEKTDCYLNFEANPIGTLHCKYGNDCRRITLPADVERPRAECRIFADRWRADYFISLNSIRQIFGRDHFEKGDVLRGNFFKCGDETAHPHFGMWSPVECEDLDFHTPAFFGELEIV